MQQYSLKIYYTAQNLNYYVKKKINKIINIIFQNKTIFNNVCKNFSPLFTFYQTNELSSSQKHQKELRKNSAQNLKRSKTTKN